MTEFDKPIDLMILNQGFPEYITVQTDGDELKYTPQLYTSNIDGQCQNCGMELKPDYVCCPLCNARIILRAGDTDDLQ